MREYSLQARALHKEILSIDSHIDSEYSLLRPDYVDPEGLSIGQVTPYKMYQGGLSAAFFAVFVEQGPDTRKGYDSAYAYTINELDNLKEYVSQRPDSLVWLPLRKSCAGCIGKERRALFPHWRMAMEWVIP